MVNVPCAAAHTRTSQAHPKPPGAHGPIAEPERSPWNVHPLGGPGEPSNSPTPVEWIGQSTVTVTSEHTLNVTAPTDIDPTALCVDAPPQAAIPDLKDQACAAQIRGHSCRGHRGCDDHA
jgi:hypothetical protein